MLSICGADKRGPVVLNKRVWEFFFVDYYGGLPTEKCSSEAVFLSPPAHTNHPCRGEQSQARWGRRDSFSKASKWLRPPHLPLSRAARQELLCRRTRAAAGAAGLGPRVPARDEHTVPSHVAAPPRGRKPSFKGREAGGARVSGGGCSPVFVIIRKESESFRSWDNY